MDFILHFDAFGGTSWGAKSNHTDTKLTHDKIIICDQTVCFFARISGTSQNKCLANDVPTSVCGNKCTAWYASK